MTGRVVQSMVPLLRRVRRNCRCLVLVAADNIKCRTMDPLVENSVKATRRNKEEKKVLRKQLKASHTLLKHEGIKTTSQPTKVKTV